MQGKIVKILGVAAVVLLLSIAMVGSVSAADGYTITFKSGGGSGEMSPVILASGVTTYTLPENGFTKDGYHFDCWQVSGNATAAYMSSPGAVISVNENLTVTAEWHDAIHTNWTELTDTYVQSAEGKIAGVVPAGNYYLNGNVTLSTNNIKITGEVIFCLNGYVLQGTGNGSVITINNGGNLTLLDCNTTQTHKFRVGDDSKASGEITGLWYLDENGSDTSRVYKTVTGGVITGGSGNISGSKYDGGGVYINNGGSFTMNGGNIVGNIVKSPFYAYGGGVYVGGSGSFTMNDGIIKENNASHNGGGVYIRYGLFTMSGGSIENNIASVQGGGVYLHNDNINNKFTMSGGSIKNNTAHEGGGVYNTRLFTMSGGSIENNTATNNGGGVLNNNMMTISNGIIKSNTAGWGGGVYSNGTFTMSGGGVNTVNGSFIMTGGTVNGNSGTYLSGGVYSSSTSVDSIIIGGTANISNNKLGTNDNNLYLRSDQKIKLSTEQPLVYGASIGVTTHDIPSDGNLVDVTSNYPDSVTSQTPWESFFKSDNQNYKVCVYDSGDGMKVVLSKNQFYTVMYSGNGATSGTAPGVSYQSSNPVTVEGNTGNLVKEDYSFGGWNMKADGTGTTYQANDTILLENGVTSVKLYAKWNPLSYTVVIPSSVSMGSSPVESEYKITITNAVTGNKNVQMTLNGTTGGFEDGHYNLVYMNDSTKKIPYTITKNSNPVLIGDEIVSASVSDNTGKPKSATLQFTKGDSVVTLAGSYKDTLTFKVEVVPVVTLTLDTTGGVTWNPVGLINVSSGSKISYTLTEPVSTTATVTINGNNYSAEAGSDYNITGFTLNGNTVKSGTTVINENATLTAVITNSA